MIDAEKLLGGMLKNSMGDMGHLGNKAAIGMGLIGIAIAAAEHFMENRGSAAPPPPPGSGTMKQPENTRRPVPPPPPGSRRSVQAPPSPPEYVPVPPPGTSSASPSTMADNSPHAEALLLIRAMIAAAGSDGNIDQEERRRIMLRLEGVDITKDEKRFIEQEMSNPGNATSIAAQCTNQGLARKVYAVSLLAIDIDTEAERSYLKELAAKLGLGKATVEQIHGHLGIPMP